MSTMRIEELERRIAELKCRLPAHSVPPAMLQQLEELEEELIREQKKAVGTADNAETDGHSGLQEMSA